MCVDERKSNFVVRPPICFYFMNQRYQLQIKNKRHCQIKQNKVKMDPSVVNNRL